LKKKILKDKIEKVIKGIKIYIKEQKVIQIKQDYRKKISQNVYTIYELKNKILKRKNRKSN